MNDDELKVLKAIRDLLEDAESNGVDTSSGDIFPALQELVDQLADE